MRQFQLFVRNLSGRSDLFSVCSETDTVASLKTKVYQRQGIPSHQQRLVCGGTELHSDDKLLCDCVTPDSTLDLGLRLLGGMPPKKKKGKKGDDDDEKAQEKKPERKCEVIHVDMDQQMQDNAVKVANEALDECKTHKDIAARIKRQFDILYPSDGKSTSGVYHCIVGSNFAASCTFETHFVMYFKLENHHILIFKSKDNPYD